MESNQVSHRTICKNAFWKIGFSIVITAANSISGEATTRNIWRTPSTWNINAWAKMDCLVKIHQVNFALTNLSILPFWPKKRKDSLLKQKSRKNMSAYLKQVFPRDKPTAFSSNKTDSSHTKNNAWSIILKMINHIVISNLVRR